MKRGIRRRLVSAVLLTVAAAFLICGVGSSFYFLQTLTDQLVHDELQKLCQASRQIKSIQDNAVYMSRAIAIDHSIQDSISRYSREDAVSRLFRQEDVRTRLIEYLNDKPYFYTVRIVTPQTIYVSHSNMDRMEIRDEWYLQFKDGEENSVFTGVHESYDPATREKVPVISYIQRFYDLESGKMWRGDIIVDINLEYLLQNAKLDCSILNGYALYTENGNVVYEEGSFSQKETDLSALQGHAVLRRGGSYLLSDQCMLGNWTFVSEISNGLLMKTLTNVPLFFLGVFLAVLFPLSAILFHYIRRILNPVDQLTQAAAQVGCGNFDFTVKIESCDEFQSLGEAFNRMTADIARYIQQSIEYEQSVKRMEIDRLMLQINPHFIYNTLDSIVYMARIDGNREIAEFTSAFIRLLQDTLRVDNGSPFLTLRQEISNLRHYLVLQKYRYPDKFEEVLEIPERYLDCKVPKVLLQPLAENAIFHGLCCREEKGRLWVSASSEKEGKVLILRVEDNGVGMSPETMDCVFNEQESTPGGMRKIGLHNIKRRVEELYGEPFGVWVESEQGKGTAIVIRLPYEV